MCMVATYRSKLVLKIEFFYIYVAFTARNFSHCDVYRPGSFTFSFFFLFFKIESTLHLFLALDATDAGCLLHGPSRSLRPKRLVQVPRVGRSRTVNACKLRNMLQLSAVFEHNDVYFPTTVET